MVPYGSLLLVSVFAPDWWFFWVCLWHAVASWGNSHVWNSGHILSWNSWNCTPSPTVTSSMISRVSSECKWSFTRPCQWAHMNSNSSIKALQWSGRRPSNTGMAHCPWMSILVQRCWNNLPEEDLQNLWWPSSLAQIHWLWIYRWYLYQK